MKRIFLATSCLLLSTFSYVQGMDYFEFFPKRYKEKSYLYFLNNGQSRTVNVVDLKNSHVRMGKKNCSLQETFSVLLDPERFIDTLASENGPCFLQFYNAVAENRYGPGGKDIANPSQNPPDKKGKCIRPFYCNGKTYYFRLEKSCVKSIGKLAKYISDIEGIFENHADKELRRVSLKEWYIGRINEDNQLGLFLNPSILAKNENVRFLKKDDSLLEDIRKIEFQIRTLDPLGNNIIIAKFHDQSPTQKGSKKRIQQAHPNEDDSQAPEGAPKVSKHKDIKKKSTKVKTEKEATSGGEPASESSRKTKIFKNAKCQAKAPVSLMYGVSRNEEGIIELEKGVEWTPYLAKLTYLTLQKVVQQDPTLNAQNAEKKLTESIKDNPIETFADQKLCEGLSIENGQIKMKSPSKSDKEIFLRKKLICLVLSSNPPQELKDSCHKILDALSANNDSPRKSKGTQATNLQFSPDIFSLTATDKTEGTPWKSVIYFDMARAQNQDDFDGLSRLLPTIPSNAVFAERFTERSAKNDKKTQTSPSQTSVSEGSDNEQKHGNASSFFEEEEEEADLEGSL